MSRGLNGQSGVDFKFTGTDGMMIYVHITPLLRQLHWIKVPERIDYKLALLVYKCLKGVAPSYLADDLCRTQASRLDIVYVRPRHRLWLCAVRGCRRTAIELSRLPPHESGTVCHICSHCMFSAVG